MRLLGVVALAACLAVACAAVSTRTLLRRAASRYSWEPDPGATQVANPPPYWKPGPEWQKAETGVYYKFPEPGKGDWKKGFCVSKPDVTQAEMSSLSERQWVTDLMWFLGQGCNAGNKYHVRNWEGKGMLNDCASTVGLVFFDCCFQGKWTVVPRQGNEVYASNCEKLYRIRQWWDALAGEDGAAFCVCSQTRDYIRRRMANFASKLDDPRNLQPPPSISGDEPPAPFSSSYQTPSSLAQAPKKPKNKPYRNNGLSSASDSDPVSSWQQNNNGKSRNAASWGLNGANNNNNNNVSNNVNNNAANGKTQTGAAGNNVNNKAPGGAQAPAPGSNKTPGTPSAPAADGTNANANANNNNKQPQAPANGVKQGAPQSPTAAVNGVKQGSPQTSASQTANKTTGAAAGQKPVQAQPLNGNNNPSSNNNNNNNNNGSNNNSPSSNGASPSNNGANISGSGDASKKEKDSPFVMSKDDSMTIITNDNSMIHKESHIAGH